MTTKHQQSRIPPVSPRLLKLFTSYTRRYVAWHFHTVRLSRRGKPGLLSEGPLVIFLNHPSWWDPLICLLLALHYFPERRHYAPIEAKALARYCFFERIGFFGVESGTRGGVTFLRTGWEILQQSQAVLWITPEGRFTDPRVRPVHLQPGIGHLAQHLTGVAFLPLALEYLFWEERFPEVLIRFGEVVMVNTGRGIRSAAEWTHLLTKSLEATQDALAIEAQRRDKNDFDILLRGRAGAGGIYDLWRSLRAWSSGEQFRRGHGEEDI